MVQAVGVEVEAGAVPLDLVAPLASVAPVVPEERESDGNSILRFFGLLS